MADHTEDESPVNNFTLRSRLINILSLNEGMTTAEIADVVEALAQPASTVPQAEFASVSAANERLRKALSTLVQVNRAQAGMLEDVFIERGVG